MLRTIERGFGSRRSLTSPRTQEYVRKNNAGLKRVIRATTMSSQHFHPKRVLKVIDPEAYQVQFKHIRVMIEVDMRDGVFIDEICTTSQIKEEYGGGCLLNFV